MTRRLWSELRDRYLQTPEQREAYEQARAALDAELQGFAPVDQDESVVDGLWDKALERGLISQEGRDAVRERSRERGPN